MLLKKINALLGELSILFMLAHIGYNVFAYVTFYYNPFIKNITAYPCMVLICLHAVCGMLIMFFTGDKGGGKLYIKQNIGTILQRISAILILPLLILHINTFNLMKASAEQGLSIYIILLMLGEVLFFACVITHISLSLTKGLVTLGILTSERLKNVLDVILYVVFFLVFAASCIVVIKGQAEMFLGVN